MIKKTTDQETRAKTPVVLNDGELDTVVAGSDLDMVTEDSTTSADVVRDKIWFFHTW